MTIVENHKGNLKGALLEEIELLAKSRVLNKSRMDATEFNPLNPISCFVGQIFGVHSPNATEHRKIVGRVPEDNSKDYRYSALYMTPLEVWAAENWKENKEDVMAVFDYIVSNGEALLPDIKFE